ncbi:MAG: serine/threonine protein kinase [Thermodesulfobacteriota bacterium]
MTSFSDLAPHQVLDAVEEGLGQPCSNICRPLNSYINRVYEVNLLESDETVIAKFYRPGRWAPAALEEEHDFTRELFELDIPVIAPFRLTNGHTLAQFGGITYAIFPKKGGRFLAELNDEQWLEMGHLIGRLHRAGAGRLAPGRVTLTPDQVTRAQVAEILAGPFLPPELQESYARETSALLALITPLFSDVRLCRLHGDCHFANLIHRPGESFFLFDFDDMANGPAVQDFWMLLPGYHHECLREIELFLEGYETFHPFDRRQLALIEPLRAMRYIHFCAWCAHQAAAGGVSPTISRDWGSDSYWRQEIMDLAAQRSRIENSLTAADNY